MLRCVERPESVPGEGEWSFTIHEQATGLQIDPLVGALRLPSEPRTNNACTAELRLPVTVAVQTTSGDAMTVAAPTDVCGKTRREVVAAYKSLTWTPTSRTRGKLVRPEAALAAGCDAWKDVLAISAEQAAAGGPGRVLPATLAGGDVRVCLYRAVYPHGWTPSSNTVVDGEPVGGGVPDAAEIGRLEALLDAAGPAADCSQRHTRLAVITAGSKQYFEPVYIELNGCLRVLAPDGTLRQADSRLATMLASMTTETGRPG